MELHSTIGKPTRLKFRFNNHTYGLVDNKLLRSHTKSNNQEFAASCDKYHLHPVVNMTALYAIEHKMRKNYHTKTRL